MQPVQQEFRVVVLSVAVFGHYCKFMLGSVVETPAWYQNAGSLRSSFEHLHSSRLKWMNVVELR